MEQSATDSMFDILMTDIICNSIYQQSSSKFIKAAVKHLIQLVKIIITIPFLQCMHLPKNFGHCPTFKFNHFIRVQRGLRAKEHQNKKGMSILDPFVNYKITYILKGEP